MDNKLKELLSDMSDEDFFELKRNMEISYDLRNLQKGEMGYTEEQIMRKLDITHFDLLYIFNGAFEFTTRHMGIIDVMKEEYDFLNSDIDYDDTEEEVDIADRDIPDSMNYGKDNKDDKDDKIIYLGGSRELTEEEERELEEQDRADILDNSTKIETMEELSARLNREYLAREKDKGKTQENTDSSIVTFN